MDTGFALKGEFPLHNASIARDAGRQGRIARGDQATELDGWMKNEVEVRSPLAAIVRLCGFMAVAAAIVAVSLGGGVRLLAPGVGDAREPRGTVVSSAEHRTRIRLRSDHGHPRGTEVRYQISLPERQIARVSSEIAGDRHEQRRDPRHGRALDRGRVGSTRGFRAGR